MASPTDATATSMPVNPQANSRDGFVCPYCGKCTMEQFFSDGCPKQVQAAAAEKKKTLFPYLDMSNINEADWIDFQDRLTSETREIKLRFARFTLNVIRSLEILEIPLEKIKVSLLSLTAFTDNIGVKTLDMEDKCKIEAATTLSEVFIVLQNYISFFNYHIIEHIIDQHGATRDRTWLEEYLRKFHIFCQRSIFEVPKNLFPSISRFTAKVFALKCTEGVVTMQGLKGVMGQIAKIFHMRPAALQLCSIKKGCVELHFLISTAVADIIFPVSSPQHLALSEIGVKVLFCKEVDQIRGEDTEPTEAALNAPIDLQEEYSRHSSATLVRGTSDDNLTSEDKLPTSEYRALCKSYDLVTIYIRARLEDFSDALFKDGYISRDVYDYVRQDAVPDGRKAHKLADAVIDKVELDSRVFLGLMSILKSEGPQAHSIIEKIEDCLKAEQATFAEEAFSHSLTAYDATIRSRDWSKQQGASKRNIASHSTAADQFTFEYLTIRKSYRRLVSYFSQETEEICDALFEKGYITPPVRDYVRIETIQPRQKARKLADALIDMVGQKSSVFYGFLGILKNEGPSTDNIVQQLEEGFAAERAVLVDSGQTSEEETTLHTYSSIPRRDFTPSTTQNQAVSPVLSAPQPERTHVHSPSHVSSATALHVPVRRTSGRREIRRKGLLFWQIKVKQLRLWLTQPSSKIESEQFYDHNKRSFKAILYPHGIGNDEGRCMTLTIHCLNEPRTKVPRSNIIVKLLDPQSIDSSIPTVSHLIERRGIRFVQQFISHTHVQRLSSTGIIIITIAVASEAEHSEETDLDED